MSSAAGVPSWLDRGLYPFEPRWHSTPHGRMHYVDEGSGPPVVLVHGNPTWSFQFRQVIPLLEGRRAIAPDHLGFGLSEKPVGYSYRPADQAAVLAGFLDSLDLRGATLVVGDWGGPLGLSWALDNPDRVAALVITNTWMWSVSDDWYYQGFSRFMGGPVGRRLILRRNFFAGDFLKRVYGDRSALTPAIHRHYLQPLGTPDERMGSAVFPREIIGSSDWLASLWDRRAALQDKRAALVWGMKDLAFRDKELRRWQELFPEAEATRLEGCGHFVAEERPAELASEILRVSGP
ncbi:MAG: alpha/beta fold hydrolase [Actinobacteria bacterium]|nr:alpha/beta fold hydrolase [Actinomycetota bacterium]